MLLHSLVIKRKWYYHNTLTLPCYHPKIPCKFMKHFYLTILNMCIHKQTKQTTCYGLNKFSFYYGSEALDESNLKNSAYGQIL